MTTGVLFICMGNICRSPLAEGLFRTLAEQQGVAGRFRIDSAGTTGHHTGEAADARMRAVAERHGVVLTSRARQVTARDFDAFEHLVCMDEANRDALLAMGAPPERIRLLLSVDANATVAEVPDPYYGEGDGFETVYRLVAGAAAAWLDALRDERGAAPATGPP